MSRFRLYLDEDNQDRDLLATLDSAGVDVARSATEGLNGTPDATQLEFATRQGRVLYTSNARDFNVLHRAYIESGQTHAGIILRYGRRFSIGEQARRIIRIWEALSAEEMVNRVESLSHWGEDRP